MKQCSNCCVEEIIVIDKDGYRPNVGIVIVNDENKLLLAERVQQKGAWQFPQGGVDEGESPEQAMYRELQEELGLREKDIEVLGESKDWISYEIPKQFRRYRSKPLCIGQKQKWFLCRLISDEDSIRLDYSENPEFDAWCWVDYWYPTDVIIEFKRSVYKRVLEEFFPLLK